MGVTLASPPDARGRVRQVSQRLIADLGCPAAFVLSARILRRVMWGFEASKKSNYGWLEGFSVRVTLPDLDFDERLPAYANSRALRIATDEGFDGIAGKPFLDCFHWGNGDGGELCLESWTQYRAHRARETIRLPTRMEYSEP